MAVLTDRSIEINQSLVKIQEICHEKVANQVNRRVRLQDLQVSRIIFPVFLTKGRLIYGFETHLRDVF